MASTLESHDGSVEDQPFHIEQHGIDFIPEQERWATARNIGAMWTGSAVNVEYFIYGAILMGFGFSFWTSLSLIVLGNLSFLLLGVASLQGPESGTTAFAISRAPFGLRHRDIRGGAGGPVDEDLLEGHIRGGRLYRDEDGVDISPVPSAFLLEGDG